MRPPIIPVLLFFFALAPGADEAPPPQVLEELPEPPPSPAGSAGDEELEPEVTIRKRGEETIEEYRIKSRIYMVKVIPRVGLPYYYLDTDGDGLLGTRQYDYDKNLQINQWIILSW
jgi:Protein of unknown function (DUF2782).